PAEARRLSFRALDIEQIGHVYESLLDHTAVRADEPVLGLAGTRDKEPEIPLPALEAFWLNPAQPEQGVKEKELLDFLQEQTGRSTSALKKALPPATPPPDLPRLAKLRAACGNNDALYARVLPWANLVRDDDFGQPVVIPAGSVYVTAGTERRATGTHYTPKALTEPIVQHTLEPLVYTGPAQGRPREQWQLRPAANLLNLKVCDMAMGSGAFLVQACRYLSERLVEAWAEAEKQVQARAAKRKGVKGEAVADAVHNSSLTIHNSPFVTPEGQPATGDPGEQIIPADPDERLLLARRLVADRCLYGVDKNPLAVEMAKLSLWLITLDKNRPFTFLDHALKCGDSLVGVNLAQLLHWNLEAAGAQPLYADTIRTDLNRMVSLRRQLAALPVNTITDQAHKAHLLAKAEAVAHNLKRGGDMLIGSYFNDLPAGEQQDLRDALLLAFNAGKDVPPDRAPARPTCRRACAPSTGRWNFQRCFWTKAAADLMRLWAIHCLLVDGVFVKLLGTVIASCFMKFTQGLAGMQTTAHFSFLEVITIYNREEHWG
ncbi:MAG: hypothetical protein JW953_04205, partial [Anaerolineae bacterium]|nr:hypothetical protein [Anaerolineae bacterium]